MKANIGKCLALIMISTATPAAAQINLTGYFIARSECPAYQSLRKASNPGNMATEIDRAYGLVGKNKEAASHYLISMKATPQLRWVAVGCGEHVLPVIGNSTPTAPLPASASQQHYVLAVSWQAGFCEIRPSKPECRNQREDRFDASNFTLHGLWPQPHDNIYCNVAPATVATDKSNRWEQLPVVELAAATRERLNRLMPGSQSHLHRHEWIKHGTCYGEAADVYFQNSLKLLDELNASTVRDVFAHNVGEEINASQIRSAFDASFGTGAGDRIEIRCKKDGGRNLITEITISLLGSPDMPTLGEGIAKAPKVNDIGCSKGLVDRVGLQ